MHHERHRGESSQQPPPRVSRCVPEAVAKRKSRVTSHQFSQGYTTPAPGCASRLLPAVRIYSPFLLHPQVGFYPYLRGDSVRYHKVVVESATGRRTLEKEVTCMQQICLPHVVDGCADETNLVLANILLSQLGGA